jgi:hypothetical protein
MVLSDMKEGNKKCSVKINGEICLLFQTEGIYKDTALEQREDLSIVGSWLFLDRCKARWSQTTKSIYLYSLPGMGPGPRVVHLKFNT